MYKLILVIEKNVVSYKKINKTALKLYDIF